MQEEAAGVAAAFDFTCLPSPGKGQIGAAQDIIFRAIFKHVARHGCGAVWL